MKNLIILLTIVFAIAACKGRGTGPLVKDSFTKTSSPMGGQVQGNQVKPVKADITIAPCEGCITISKLLAEKKSFSGKTIKVTGQVTKFLPQIMGKNWIHLQDGTEFEGGFDLTITTDKQVNVGDKITFEGKITLDKDFGYGYFYAVLMEEGKIVQ
jgi:hypothetical protein